MTRHPFVLRLDGETVTLGEVLERQVNLLCQAHQRRDRVAAEVLCGTGVARGTEDEVLGSELTLETARRSIARDHGYADWPAARRHAGLMVDTRFEVAADATGGAGGAAPVA